jgi:hypothetical protein
MLRRLMGTLWTLPDGSRCDLIAIVPSLDHLLAAAEWEVEIVRGSDRLRCESFTDIDSAYGAARRWRIDAERLAETGGAKSA